MSAALFAWPAQAWYGGNLPKNKLYERARVSARLREQFVSQVDRIVWRYKLAPETINLPAKPGVPEIQVFSIHLKTPELHHDVLRCIDSAVHYPIVFELVHGAEAEARTQMIAAYKRPIQADASQWVLSEYFTTDWLPATTARGALPVALDLADLYEQILYRLLPVPVRANESLSDLLARVEQLAAKRREVSKTEARLAKAKQFNRKVEINSTLRQLRAELQGLLT